MENTYSLVHVLNDLKKKGYTVDFNLRPDCIECDALEIRIKPEDFYIDEIFRFEGMSDPGDNSIVYAISTNGGVKGVLVDGYGISSDNLNEAMISKLKRR